MNATMQTIETVAAEMGLKVRAWVSGYESPTLGSEIRVTLTDRWGASGSVRKTALRLGRALAARGLRSFKDDASHAYRYGDDTSSVPIGTQYDIRVFV